MIALPWAPWQPPSVMLLIEVRSSTPSREQGKMQGRGGRSTAIHLGLERGNERAQSEGRLSQLTGVSGQ